MRYDAANLDVILGLHEAVQHKAWQAIEALAFIGEDALMTDGKRTFDEQEDLWHQGRDRPGKIVTNARGGWSFHNYGLAFDIVPVGPLGIAMSARNKLEWAAIGRYETYGRELQSIGFQWGFQLWGFDRPHFQYVTEANGHQLTIEEVRAGRLPDVARACNERKAALIERIDVAKRALSKSFLKPGRRKQAEEFVATMTARLEQIR